MDYSIWVKWRQTTWTGHIPLDEFDRTRFDNNGGWRPLHWKDAISTKRNALTKSKSISLKSLRFFGGEALDLQEAFASNLTKIRESKRLRAQGTYNIKKKSSPIDISHAKFVSELEIYEYEGKSYLRIPGDGGIIEVASQEDKELFLYSVYSIPPMAWGINKVWQNHVVWRNSCIASVEISHTVLLVYFPLCIYLYLWSVFDQPPFLNSAIAWHYDPLLNIVSINRPL